MNLIVKIISWLLLIVCAILVANMVAGYFDWPLWLKFIFAFGLFLVFFFVRWLWRYYRLKRHLSLLSISDTIHFDGVTSLQLGLKQLKQQGISRKDWHKKPWYIGIAFHDLGDLYRNPRIELESNSQNIRVSIVVFKEMFVLVFEMTSRLLLEREEELFKSYFRAFYKLFHKQLLGQLCFLNAPHYETVSSEALTDMADAFSKLNAIMVDVCAKHLPVNVIFHNIQQIPYYPDFLARLSRQTKAEAFGWQASQWVYMDSGSWNNLKETIWQALLTRCEQAFGKQLTLSTPECYLFLQHIHQQLKQLQQFLGAASQKTPMAFTSLYWLESLENAKGSKSETFSQKVFKDYLPYLPFKPVSTGYARAVKQSRQKTYLIVYGLLMLTGLAYVSFAYQQESRLLLNQLKEFPKKIYLDNQVLDNLDALFVYQDILSDLDKDQQNNWLTLLPYRAGFDQLKNAYTKTFVKHFQQSVLAPLDQQLLQAVQNEDTMAVQKARAKIILHVMYRLNLLNAKLHHTELTNFSSPSIWLLNSDPNDFFASLYKIYIDNNSDAIQLQQEYTNLTHVAELLNLDQQTFTWLPDYINTKIPESTISLSQLWGGSKPISLDNDNIDASYTLEGSKQVIQFWDDFNNAFGFLGDFSKQQQSFYFWYQNLRYKQWTAFLKTYNRGYLSFNNKNEWDNAMMNMYTSNNGPYQLIFKLISGQFNDDISQKYTTDIMKPSWLILGERFSTILNYDIHDDKAIKYQGTVSSIETIVNYSKQKQSEAQLMKKAKSVFYDKVDRQQMAANDFYAYSQALKQLQSAPLVAEQAYFVSKAIYGGTFATFNTALTKEAAIETNFISLNLQSNVFWLLVKGPLDFYVRYVNLLAAGYLNNAWQTDVLVKAQDVPSMFVSNLLFSDNGIFWDFYNKYLASYLLVKNSLVLPKFVLNISFPFTNSFYSLLNSAASTVSLHKQQSLYNQYFSSQTPSGSTVAQAANLPADLQPPSIAAYPPDMNAEATVRPQQVRLNAQCGKDNFELVNYNFPIQKVLAMPLSNCQKTVLSIYFNDFILEKEYSTLLDFLETVQNNQVAFKASDFPQLTSYLTQYHIETVTLHYQLNGLAGMMQQYRAYLKLQKDLAKYQKDYNVATDLPAVIADDSNQGSFRDAMALSDQGFWSQGQDHAHLPHQ